MIDRTCLRVSQLAALLNASARASKYNFSEGGNSSLRPRAILIADEDIKLCHRSPALSGEMVLRTAVSISVAFLVYRCLVIPLEFCQSSHGFSSGSILQETRKSLSLWRGSILALDSSLWVDAVLSVSGDRKVSSPTWSLENDSAN